ncbi:MAG: hypothetical protein IJ995_04190 [Clostridia bacterium]|nr:hypothetical protein [Clostridia bacterium]
MQVMTLFLILLVILIIVVGIIIAINVAKTTKKKRAERPLGLEEKIVALNNQFSAGIITKEEYDRQKAALLNSI